MGETLRKPFQGIKNIIRFNWQYYLGAIILISLSLFVVYLLPSPLSNLFLVLIVLSFTGIILSIVVSYYIYDFSNLYKLDWLDILRIKEGSTLVNINAGFDETSHLIKQKFTGCKLMVLDFYNPEKHTEVSIERARKINSVYPGTINTTTDSVPLNADSIDYVFLFLSAHEIRDKNEQIGFFIQLRQSLNENGRILVTEHSRDIVNFFAYNFGIMHFFSRKHWRAIFHSAGLSIISENKITPFITNFILQKNGNTN